MDEVAMSIKSKYKTKKIEEISIMLSELLPRLSDLTFYEIDELLFQNNEQKTILFLDGIHIKQRMISGLMYSFLELVVWHAAAMHPEKLRPSPFIALLQFIEHYYVGRFYLRYIMDILYFLIDRSHTISICMALKIMVILLKKHRTQLNFYFDTCIIQNKYAIFPILTLKTIPEPIHKDKIQIRNWMNHQVTTIKTGFLQLRCFQKYNNAILTPINLLAEEKLEEYMDRVTSNLDIMPFQNNNLYDYFMSAQTEDQKLKRMECFFKSCFKASKSLSDKKYIAHRLRFSFYIQHLIKMVLRPTSILYESYCTKKTNVKEVDEHCAYKFGPYLSTNHSTECIEEPKTSNDLNSQSKENISDEPDFTFEKALLYDDIMKRIHVLNILITGFRECTELLKAEGIREVDEDIIFRKRNSMLANKIHYALLNRKKHIYRNKGITWYFETVLRKCPFLFFSKRHEHLMDDLVRYMKGENLDSGIKEEIFYALNIVGN